MSHFLFKPHVEGPSDAITSPDVIIDRLFLAEGAALSPVPTSRLTSDNSQQTVTGVQATPFYALTSLGGGIIISPGVKLDDDRVIVARKAWRLNNLSAHTERLTLNGTELANLCWNFNTGNREFCSSAGGPSPRSHPKPSARLGRREHRPLGITPNSALFHRANAVRSRPLHLSHYRMAFINQAVSSSTISQISLPLSRSNWR